LLVDELGLVFCEVEGEEDASVQLFQDCCEFGCGGFEEYGELAWVDSLGGAI
jgi:hypothetical protein